MPVKSTKKVNHKYRHHPWARGFCLPTSEQRQAAVGPFPLLRHAPHGHCCQHPNPTMHRVQPAPCLGSRMTKIGWPTFDGYMREVTFVRSSSRWTSRAGASRTGGLFLVPIVVVDDAGGNTTAASTNDDGDETMKTVRELQRYLFAFWGRDTFPSRSSDGGYAPRQTCTKPAMPSDVCAVFSVTRKIELVSIV